MDSRRRGVAYEEWLSAVYLRMVKLGHPTREALIADGLPADEIDEAVAELTVRGFLEPDQGQEGEVEGWRLRPPREAIGQHLQDMEHQIAMTRATAAEVESAWRRSVGRSVLRDLPDIDLLAGTMDIVDRVAAFHLSATRRLWWVVDGSAAARILMQRAVEDPDYLAVRDGVDVRVVADSRLLEDVESMAHLTRLAEQGHGVRIGYGVPFSTILCDDTSTIIDLSAHDAEGFGSFAVRRPAAISAIEKFTESAWVLATRYAVAIEVEDWEQDWDQQAPPLDPRDQKILALLATGATDQTIARQTQVSTRTVERRVRKIIDQLGSSTRFQAGVQAVHRGWV